MSSRDEIDISLTEINIKCIKFQIFSKLTSYVIKHDKLKKKL